MAKSPDATPPSRRIFFFRCSRVFARYKSKAPGFFHSWCPVPLPHARGKGAIRDAATVNFTYRLAVLRGSLALGGVRGEDGPRALTLTTDDAPHLLRGESGESRRSARRSIGGGKKEKKKRDDDAMMVDTAARKGHDGERARTLVTIPCGEASGTAHTRGTTTLTLCDTVDYLLRYANLKGLRNEAFTGFYCKSEALLGMNIYGFHDQCVFVPVSDRIT